MKKIYLLLLSVIFTFSVFAQHRTYQHSSLKPIVKEQLTSTNTKGVSDYDTLYPGNWESATNFELYSSDGWGYLIGNNNYGDLAKGQKFVVTSPYAVVGAFFWFGAKAIVGTPDTLMFAIVDMDGPDSSPSTMLSAKSVALDQIPAGLDFPEDLYYLEFSSPTTVTSDYLIGFAMMKIVDDTIGLVTSADGQGTGDTTMNWEMWDDMSWYCIGSPDNWDINLDLGIFPVVDISVGNVENKDFVFGLKLSTIYPNPASGQCLVRYELQESDAVTIDILSSTGKLVKRVNQGVKQAGLHETTLDLSSLASGTYFCSLQAGKNRLTKPLIIK